MGSARYGQEQKRESEARLSETQKEKAQTKLAGNLTRRMTCIQHRTKQTKTERKGDV